MTKVEFTNEQRAFLGLPLLEEPTPGDRDQIIEQGKKDLDWLASRGIIGGMQLHNLRRHCLRGEEAEFFAEKMTEIRTTVEGMPALYETDGMGADAPVSLHYFRGGMDWFITEAEDPENGIMFGFACLGDPAFAELGSIGVAELTDNDVELDFHWSKKPLGEAKKGIGC